MLQTVFHKSDYYNCYIYDDRRRLSMLIHPELEKVLKNDTNSESYYFKKYRYLHKHGFFTKHENINFKSLDEAVVKNNIINTTQIVFETTGSCNLNCTYCGLGELYEGDDKRTKKNIDIKSAISLLIYIFNVKPINKNGELVITFYGGEPLLNLNFIKQIVAITKQLNKEKNFKLHFTMTTNATLIHKCIDFLVENNFNLLISLDGNEKNDSYRIFNKNKKNSFNKVIENMDMIQMNYPKYFSSYIEFNSVLHDRNSVKEIYEFIFTRYNKIPRISELNMYSIKTEKEALLKKMYRNKEISEAEYQTEESDIIQLTHKYKSLYRELIDFLNYFSVNYYVFNIRALLSSEEKYLPTTTCTPFLRKIFLTNRNKLLLCEKINYKYFMGEIDDNNIKINFSDITRQYNFHYKHIQKFCKTCYVYRYCSTCFFQLKNIDNIDSKEFFCENFNNENTFKHKLHRLFSFLEKHPGDFSDIIENTRLE